MNLILRFILSFLFLPLLLSVDLFRSQRSGIGKIGLFVLIWLILGTVWFRGYANVINITRITLYELGISDKLTSVKVVGTSMLPNIKDQESITLHSPKKYGVQRGDIVSFQNIETGNLHYIKRVIGLEGEQIAVANGTTMINGQTLREDYVFHENPTFGNTFLVECEPQLIPKGKVAVLGDNRIVSSDSRVIGFIDMKDIDGVIKTRVSPAMQTNPDNRELKEVNLNSDVFLEKLNEVRKGKNIKPLLSPSILNQIATERSITISSNFNDWKNQSIPLGQLLERYGYQYLLAQEMVTFGYLDEQQIVDQILESIYKDDFLSERYYEVGVGTAPMQKNECQSPVITIILGWPSNPSYPKTTIDVWNKDVEVLSRVISALQKLKYKPDINEQKTQELLEELSNLLEIASQISSRVQQNEWLTSAENKSMEDYFQKSQAATEKIQSYYETYEQNINDPETRELLIQLLPGNTEFNQKTEEAKLMFGRGQYNEQLKIGQKLIEIAQNDKERAMGYYWIGLAEFELNQNSEAKRDLINATQLDPQFAAPYVTLATVSFNEQNYQQGLQYSSTCVELDPNYAWCHNDLGLAYLYLGEKQKGIQALEKAVSLDPNSYIFNDNLKRARSN